MSYKVVIPKPVQKQLSDLPKNQRDRLITDIRLLSEVHRPSGVKKLKGYENIYRIRVGDYQVIYEVKDQEMLVLIISSGHRRDVY